MQEAVGTQVVLQLGDESIWPADRTFDTFNAWFDCQLHSLVLDLCDEPFAEYP